jgi:peptidoglycan/xylan/chitin deacetylase (PgdA/CDA1 family)
MTYLSKTPSLLRWGFPRRLWRLPASSGPCLYLTFDDGPIPEVTPWVLSQLKVYQAQATFFCIGDNVRKHPQVLEQVKAAGHRVGNHTYHHLNGFRTSKPEYLADIERLEKIMPTTIFRPPYGRLRSGQGRAISRKGYQIVMWDVLAGDWDPKESGEACGQRVIEKASNGSIVVMHDSLKAWSRLKIALPMVLKHFHEQGYQFKAIP